MPTEPQAFAANFTPDFLIASMGRSGSTLVCNWLTHPPERVVLSEPVFFRLHTFTICRDQYEDLGMGFTDAEWLAEDESPQARFLRLFAPRLAGKRWGFKEVVAEEYNRVLDAVTPPRVVVTVRDIGDVAASFLEKHRLQSVDSFLTPDWVRAYCERESAALLTFEGRIAATGTPYHVVRYEDFVASAEAQGALSSFLDWPGGGNTDRRLRRMDRAFESERHGPGVGAATTARSARGLSGSDASLIDAIVDACGPYQQRFGYA